MEFHLSWIIQYPLLFLKKFESALCFWDSPMLLNMWVDYSFLFPSCVPLYGYAITYLSSQLLADIWAVRIFLAITSEVTVLNQVHVFVRTCLFIFLGYIPRNRFFGSHGKYMFDLIRNCQTVSQNYCTVLYFRQEVQLLHVVANTRYCQNSPIPVGA